MRPVIFEWDPAKSAATQLRRGFDFSFACQVFGTRTHESEDERRAYGERRVVAIGLAAERLITVVFTDRTLNDGSIVRRVISARRSNRKERHLYAETFQDAEPRTGEG